MLVGLQGFVRSRADWKSLSKACYIESCPMTCSLRISLRVSYSQREVATHAELCERFRFSSLQPWPLG